MHSTVTFRDKIFDFSKLKISFIAQFNELHQKYKEVIRKLRKRDTDRISKKKQIMKCEISWLQTIVQQLHKDNEKLQNHVQKWKTIAQKSESDKIKHCEKMDKIVNALIEIKSELTCAC